MRTLRFLRLWLSALALLVLLAGCGGLVDSGGNEGSNQLGGGIGGSGDGDDGDGSGDTGSIQIALSGSHPPGVDALNLTLAGIDLRIAHASGEQDAGSDQDGWVSLDLQEQNVDIVQLVDGRMSVLVDQPVNAGSYDRIRVHFDHAEVTVFGATYSTMIVGSAQAVLDPESDILVDAEGEAIVEVDFNPVQSLQVVGQNQYKLLPEMGVVDPWFRATVSGTILPAGIGAEVRAYHAPSNTLVAAVAVRDDGTYTLPRLPVFSHSGVPMTYRFVANAPGYDMQITEDMTLLPGPNDLSFELTEKQGLHYYWWWQKRR